METRVAVMSIIVEDAQAVERLNGFLHEYGEYIIGRMGIPYRKRKVNIISIALDAPQNTIAALAGVDVPELAGLTAQEASLKLKQIGLQAVIEGDSGLVFSQLPEAGRTVRVGTQVLVYLKEDEENES